MTTPPSSGAGAGPRERPCAQCGELLPTTARFCGTCGQRVLRDFFISYNHADQGWAEWIAWCLEAAGYTTLIQAWDIRPGSNFLVEMDQAFKSTRRTLAVLSPDYLTSQFTTPEWADALRRDPTGTKRLLLPVRVRPCEPEGWLAAVVYTDLLGLPAEGAQQRLLAAVQADGRPPTGHTAASTGRCVGSPRSGHSRHTALAYLTQVEVVSSPGAAQLAHMLSWRKRRCCWSHLRYSDLASSSIRTA